MIKCKNSFRADERIKVVRTKINSLRQLPRINEHIYIISDDEFKENHFQYVENHLKIYLKKSKYLPFRIAFPLFFYRCLYQLSGKGKINPYVRYLGQNLSKSGYTKFVKFEDGLTNFACWYNIKIK